MFINQITLSVCLSVCLSPCWNLLSVEWYLCVCITLRLKTKKLPISVSRYNATDDGHPRLILYYRNYSFSNFAREGITNRCSQPISRGGPLPPLELPPLTNDNREQTGMPTDRQPERWTGGHNVWREARMDEKQIYRQTNRYEPIDRPMHRNTVRLSSFLPYLNM